MRSISKARVINQSSKKMIHHLVLLSFKKETSEATRIELERGFVALGKQISVVQSLEWGVNVSPEGLDKGLTHCFNLSFASAADRDAYLPHPAHLAFVERIKPCLADVLVLDYQATAAI